MFKDQVIIGSIMAEAETAEATETASPSLAEAYGDRSTEGSPVVRKPEKEEPQRNTRLTEERATADALAEVERQNRPRPKRDQLLSEAYEGIQPDEEAEVLIEEDGLPETLQGFDSDAVTAAMVRLGLTAEDLKDQRWVNVLRSELENELGEPDSEGEEEEEAEAEPEETDEDKPEEKKDETKTEEKPPAPVHTDLSPEDVKKYVEKTWERSQQVNSPQMTKLFADSLATALGTPPEQRELLDNVVGLLNYGGVSLIQSAVPALVTEYLKENLPAIMEAGLPPALEGHIPGLKTAFDSASIDNGWADTMESDEFKGLGLPKLHTPEFGEAMQECCDKNPWFLNFVPTGPDGERLPNLEALRVKMAIGARLMAGQRITPAKIAAQVSEAIATGKRSAERSARKITASGLLGRGRSSGNIGERKQDAGLRAAWDAVHSKDGGIS